MEAAFHNDARRAYTFFLILTLFSIPFAAWLGNAFSWFMNFFKLFLFCVMTVACIRTEDELSKYIFLYIVCMVYINYGPIQNYLNGKLDHDLATGTNRIASPIKFYKNPNVLACTLLQCVPFIYYRIAHNGFFQKKFVNSVWFAIIAIIIFVVIITGSRGGS